MLLRQTSVADEVVVWEAQAEDGRHGPETKEPLFEQLAPLWHFGDVSR